MTDLSEASLEQALKDIRNQMVDNQTLSLRPTNVLINSMDFYLAMYSYLRIYQPWRGKSRQKYLAKRRRS